MASTFELSSQYYGTRHLRLACSQTTDIATNTSTIAWTLYSEGGSSDYYTTGPTSVYINSELVYYKDTVYYNEGIFPAKKGSVSGTTTVQHNNDGTKSITVSITTAIYYSSTETKSGTWTLDSIPRYATLSTSLSSKTETTAVMSWTADATCDRLYYSTNNGSTFTQVTIADSRSGTYTITGLSANTTYNIKTKVRRKDSQLETTSSAVSVTTYNYPYATSMPNFNIGDLLTLGFYNPLGRSFQFSIVVNGSQIGNVWTISGTSYSGVNADSSMTQLYSKIPNQKSATYSVKCTYGTSVITKTGGTMYAKEADCKPTVGSVTYQDTKTATVNVTGDNQKIIQNQSTVQYTASSISTKYSATVSSVKVSVNGLTYTMSASGSNYVYGSATINSSSNVTATVTVTDSRGYTGSKAVTVSMYEWKLPTGIITMQRQNNFYTPTSIKCDAQYSYLGGHNTISITYAGTKDGDSSATVTGTLQDNVAQTINFDNEYGWTVRFTLTDAFGSTTYNVRLERGEPIVFFDRIRNSVGFGTFPNSNKQVKLNDASAIDDGWKLTVGGKNSTFNYMPYSWYTSVGYGQSAGYARIATIEIGTQLQETIHFRGTRRVDGTSFDLYIQIDGSYGIRDFIAVFPVWFGGTTFEAFAYQTSSQVWDVYVKKVVANDCITVWVEAGAWSQEDITITHSDNILPSIPSGAITAKRESNYTFRVRSRSDMSGLSSSSGANQTMRYWKSGNVVTIVLDVILATGASETVIYTLEEQYRPVSSVWGAIPRWGGVENWVSQYYRITDNGQIILYSGSNTSRLYCNITYAL